VNIGLLVLMTAINTPHYDIFLVQTDRFGQPIETYGTCVWGDSIALLVPLAVINIGIVVLALYEAWKARNLATEFAESRHIGQAVLGTLIVVCVGGPILIIARESPDASLFVNSGIIFVMVSR
jgi:7 transmembrane sweet-taste receptor of 3 GCPR